MTSGSFESNGPETVSRTLTLSPSLIRGPFPGQQTLHLRCDPVAPARTGFPWPGFRAGHGTWRMTGPESCPCPGWGIAAVGSLSPDCVESASHRRKGDICRGGRNWGERDHRRLPLMSCAAKAGVGAAETSSQSHRRKCVPPVQHSPSSWRSESKDTRPRSGARSLGRTWRRCRR